MRPRAVRIAALFVLLGLTWGCESGPSGPGTLSATVSGPQPLGAALVEVVGPAVTGFSAAGDAQAYGASVDAATGTHRVLVVSPSGGELHFGIEVEDLALDPPVATVLRVANPANIMVLASQVTVKIDEP